MKENILSEQSTGQSASEKNGGGLLSNFIATGAREWGISEARFKLMLLLPFAIAFSGVVAALMGKPAYKMFTGEDMIAEYLQVVCWVTSFLLTLWVVKNVGVYDNKVIALLYVLLAIGIFFLIGEELSWGQRLFGWQTPEAYKEINKQDETNLHNIHGVGYTFKWLHMMIGAYGAVLPLVLLRRGVFRNTRAELSMLVPHYTLIPFFLMPFTWRLYRNLFDAPKDFYFVVSEYSEVMELVLAAGFVLFLVFQKMQIDRTRQASV